MLEGKLTKTCDIIVLPETEKEENANAITPG